MRACGRGAPLGLGYWLKPTDADRRREGRHTGVDGKEEAGVEGKIGSPESRVIAVIGKRAADEPQMNADKKISHE